MNVNIIFAVEANYRFSKERFMSFAIATRGGSEQIP